MISSVPRSTIIVVTIFLFCCQVSAQEKDRKNASIGVGEYNCLKEPGDKQSTCGNDCIEDPRNIPKDIGHPGIFACTIFETGKPTQPCKAPPLLCRGRAAAEPSPSGLFWPWLLGALAIGAIGALAFFGPEIAAALGLEGLFGTGASLATGTQINSEDLSTVIDHLAQFDDYAPNDMMIDRLQAILNEGGTLSGGDENFYLHELYEAQQMAAGSDYDTAHQAALDYYGHSAFDVYPPEVIQTFPELFNYNWLQHWGIGP